MAKDLNISNLGQIVMDGEEIFLGLEGAERTQVLPAGIGGAVFDGVFVATGDTAAIKSIGREVKLPETLKAREAFLRKWAEKAADKAKSNKGLSATLLILPLAACGGGGEPAFQVEVSNSGVVSFLNATAKITMDIATGVATFTSGNAVASQTVTDLNDNVISVVEGQTVEVSVAQLQDPSVTDGSDVVAFRGDGHVVVVLNEGDHVGQVVGGLEIITQAITIDVSLTGGNLTFDLPNDDNDTIVLSSNSSISLGGGNLIVDDGVVDARLATITGANTIGNVQVASELILTKAQYDQVAGDVLGTGKLTVFVDNLADARAVQADDGDKIASAVNLVLSVPASVNVGTLTVTEFRELDGLITGNFAYNITATKDDLVVYDPSIPGIRAVSEDIAAILNGASAITITGDVPLSVEERDFLAGQVTNFTGGQNSFVVDTTGPRVTEISVAGFNVTTDTLLAGQTLRVTIKLSEPTTGFSEADVSIVNGSIQANSWSGPSVQNDGSVTYSFTLRPTPDFGPLRALLRNSRLRRDFPFSL